MVASPAKRSYTEEVHEEPIINVPQMPMPYPDVIGSNNALVVVPLARNETCPVQDGASDGPVPIKEDLD